MPYPYYCAARLRRRRVKALEEVKRRIANGTDPKKVAIAKEELQTLNAKLGHG
jgi:hypothetical protein